MNTIQSNYVNNLEVKITVLNSGLSFCVNWSCNLLKRSSFDCIHYYLLIIIIINNLFSGKLYNTCTVRHFYESVFI